MDECRTTASLAKVGSLLFRIDFTSRCFLAPSSSSSRARLYSKALGWKGTILGVVGVFHEWEAGLLPCILLQRRTLSQA